jgi:hypothetical protein
MASSFFAYPGTPVEVANCVRSALQIIKDQYRREGYEGWEQNDIAGYFLVDPIFARIHSCTFLAADITRLNFNVTFEIGYAIGLGRRVVLTKHAAFTSDDALIKDIGIFDTLGYKKYSTSNELAEVLAGTVTTTPLPIADVNPSLSAPVFVVRPKTDTDLEVHLISKIKKARLFFRSYDPNEQPRLSAQDAIKNVASSFGVIVPLIPHSRADAAVHNIRAAFVAGLARGMFKELLLIQFGDDPVPLDCRDGVQYAVNERQIEQHLSEFAPAITGLLQSTKPAIVSDSATFLSKLDLGAPAAENEFRDLSDYYLETDEYRRVLRGEIQIVSGRKGSGKSALFFSVRDKKRSSRQNVVLDLRPESYQLQKFKDLVLAGPARSLG